MSKPYINTELVAIVPIYPYQMNNEFYLHLKRNLQEELIGRCYKEYGYINKIYEILKYSKGIIPAENFMGSAEYDVTFSCQLYAPPDGLQLICKIERINKALIIAKHGPIFAMIPSNRINETNFFTDTANRIRYKKGNKSHVLQTNEYIKVTINKSSFIAGKKEIKAICFLDSMASGEEINQFLEEDIMDSMEENNENMIDAQDV